MRYKANIEPPSSPSMVLENDSTVSRAAALLSYSLQYSYLSGTTTVLATVHTICVEEILAFGGC